MKLWHQNTERHNWIRYTFEVERGLLQRKKEKFFITGLPTFWKFDTCFSFLRNKLQEQCFTGEITGEITVRRCSAKKVLLEFSPNSLEITCAKDYFVIKLQAESLRPNFIEKESLTQVFTEPL